MPDLIRVVDVSEFTTTIPHSWWRDLRDRHGVKAAVIQAWGGGYVPGRRNEHFAQHVEGALRAGLHVAAYVWPPRDYVDAFRWIEQSSYKAELAFYAHDVEADAGVTQQYVEAADQWLGRPSWIYASPASWGQIMGIGAEYADHSLWLARYPLSPERPGGNTVWWPRDDTDPFVGYEVGAWREARGWQFQGTTLIGNETCDLNLFHADAFSIQQGDDHMPTQEYDELKSRLDGLQALVRASANNLHARVGDLEDGDLEVPIWPVGLVNLRTLRHRAYHSPATIRD